MMLASIKLSAEIRGGKLVVDLPPGVEDGKVEITINQVQEVQRELTRDEIRQLLAEEGLLETDLGIPDDLEDVSEDEIEILGEMMGNPRSSEDLIAEDRGAY